MIFLHDLAEGRRRGVAVGVPPAVFPEPVEESSLAHHVAQHGQHHAALVVDGRRVVRRRRCAREIEQGKDAFVARVGDAVALCRAADGFVVGVRPAEKLGVKELAEHGEALVQPGVTEVGAGDPVAPPHVREFMGRRRARLGEAGEQLFGIADHGLVLHRTDRRDAVADLVEGVGTEALREGLHHARHGGEISDRARRVGPGHEVLHGDAVPVILHDRVVADGVGKQVRGRGMRLDPSPGALAVRRAAFVKQPGAGDRESLGHGEGNVEGGLVRRHVVGGQPAPHHGHVGIGEAHAHEIGHVAPVAAAPGEAAAFVARGTGVEDADLRRVPRRQRRGEFDGEHGAVVAECADGASGFHRGDSHRNQVERDLGEVAARGVADGDRRVALDLPRRQVEADQRAVVHDVDERGRGLQRIAAEKEGEGDEDRTHDGVSGAGAWGHFFRRFEEASSLSNTLSGTPRLTR